MTDFIRTIIIMSASGSILALALIVMKPLVRERLPKAAQYYLWLVVLAALLVPISKFVIMPANASNMPTAPIQTVIEQIIPSAPVAPAVPEAQSPAYGLTPATETVQSKTVSTAIIITLIYALGVLAVLLRCAVTFIEFTRLHRRRNIPAREKETALLTGLCKNHCVPLLYRNPLAVTPMLVGVFHPAIILPDREYTDVQLRNILIHELIHLRRKDVLVKWLAVLASAVHWFNPIVWITRYGIDRACEFSCDEAVIRNLGKDGRQSYGDTLIYIAADSRIPGAVPATTMCEGKKALKERLGAIMKSRKQTHAAVIVSAVVVAAAVFAAAALGAGRGEKTDKSLPEARKWLDYYHEEQMNWDGSLELKLPEYPNTTFRWTTDEVTAIEPDGEKTLFGGMPIWNVYTADLTGDRLPELCATVSFGSGIVDTHVVVYDYANSKLYTLSDRMLYDYVLSLENGRLIVTQSKYNGEKLAAGDLAIIDGVLAAAGIDHTSPETEPKETSSPMSANKQIQPAGATWTPETPLGVEGVPEFDYASDKYVIFHSYFGLYVYDLQMRQIIRSLDLVPLGCQYVQGGDACEISVNSDGSIVYMRTMETRKMYIWKLAAEPDSSLYSGDFDRDWPEPNERFIRVSTESVMPGASGTAGVYSLYAADFGGYYGYLYAGNPENISGLQYVAGDETYQLFR